MVSMTLAFDLTLHNISFIDLRLSGKPPLDIKHLFSAEIVPYKQAYIERNFGPDCLFRDMRELAEGGQA